MPDQTPLSPRAAVAIGLCSAVCGIVPMLVGLGVLGSTAPDTPLWVVFCAGLMFVLTGAAIILGYAVAGGAGPDGDLTAGTPFGVRVAQYLIGIVIVGLLSAIATWIAFGPGERQFSTTFTLPFTARAGKSSEIGGRAAFGIGAVLLWAMCIGFAVVAVRRLRRWRGRE